MVEINSDEFSLLTNYLLDTWGIDITEDKKYLLHTRLSGFLANENCTTFGEFYRKLRAPENLDLDKRLIEEMTTNETSFFRDQHPFETLIDCIMPGIVKKKNENISYLPPKIRIWSAGCSTGQEAYTIAIVLHRWLAESGHNLTMDNFSILATDISGRVLNRAKEGVYAEGEFDDRLPEYFKRDYFEKAEDRYRIVSDIKKHVVFSEVNLAQPIESLGCFDVILCRNVIIYFSKDLKGKIIDQFYNMLNPSGVLMLGASESLYMLSDKFSAEHNGQTIYYVKT
ncbi:MAG: CheR family methyltransferase [Planctomycetota bacterium]|jgi:chemotaxis protein methyltransferase CheR